MTSTATEGATFALSSIAAARIRGLRSELRLNQTQLAQMTGLSRTAISDRESGVKPVNVDELPAFASALRTSIEYLLGLTNDRTPSQMAGGSGVVRHVGLEPTTRCLEVSRRSLRLVWDAARDAEGLIGGLERILSEIDQIDAEAVSYVEWGAAGAGNTSGLAPSVATEIEAGPLAPVIDLATGERVA